MKGVSSGAFFTVRPITLWPHPETHRRERGAWRATYGNTRSLLHRECRLLGATSAVIQVAVTEQDIRLDGELRATARPSHPGVIVSFDSEHGPLSYATDAFDHWQSNLRAIAVGLERLRSIDRYGIARSGEQYTGWKQLTAGTSTDGASDPRRGEQLVREHGSLRAAIQATHPDHGGTAADLRDVLAYREAVTA